MAPFRGGIEPRPDWFIYGFIWLSDEQPHLFHMGKLPHDYFFFTLTVSPSTQKSLNFPICRLPFELIATQLATPETILLMVVMTHHQNIRRTTLQPFTKESTCFTTRLARSLVTRTGTGLVHTRSKPSHYRTGRQQVRNLSKFDLSTVLLPDCLNHKYAKSISCCVNSFFQRNFEVTITLNWCLVVLRGPPPPIHTHTHTNQTPPLAIFLCGSCTVSLQFMRCF